MSYNAFLNKPENALRRAEELLSISQPSAALALLHEILSSRRHKTWSPTYEKIIILYLDLCLQLGRSREAKDGLHQYRNLSQSQAPGSLEAVIRHLIEASEKKCREAKEAADKGELPKPVEKGEGEEATADDDDADFYEGSHLLLSTMSTDPEKAQRDTAVLLPALKFLWEVYRAVLDILKSNSKLERLYHGAAVAALRFCAEYKRRVEFRRVCDMMRMHLGNLQKFGGVGTVSFDAGRNNKVRSFACRFYIALLTNSLSCHVLIQIYKFICRSVAGKDGPLNPSNSIYRHVSHNLKQHLPYVFTPRDFVLLRTFTTFSKLAALVASYQELTFLPQKPRSWLLTTRN